MTAAREATIETPTSSCWWPAMSRAGLGAAGLAVLGMALGLSVNALRERPLSLAPYHPAGVCSAALVEEPIGLVTPHEVAELCSESGVVVIDVRSAQKYAEGHVTGALHLPCTASPEAALMADSVLEGKRTIIIYGETNEQAKSVAETLATRTPGRSLVTRILDGGFTAWSEASLACSSGPCEACDALQSKAHRQ